MAEKSPHRSDLKTDGTTPSSEGRGSRYRILVESAPVCIHEIDLEGRLTSMNPAGLCMMGAQDESEIRGLEYLSVVSDEEREHLHELMEAARNGRPSHFEFSTADHRKHFSSSFIPIFDEEGKVQRLMGITEDITERRQSEDARRKLLDKLEVVNAELERFVYTASHDLKSPLITISGFLGLVRQDAQQGRMDALHRDLDAIERATLRMSELLDGLLDLSRAGQVIKTPEPISLGDLLVEACEQVEGQLKSRGVEVVISPDPPDVYVDRPRFLEVLQNLIGNATKYIGDQAQPKIEIFSERREEWIYLSVRDNGIGIDSSDQDKIFGLFERLDTEIPGTGIGLAVAKRLIEAHGGRIRVESAGLGEGTCFIIELPHAPCR